MGFLSQIKDRNSADYKKYFDELMDVYDLRMKYIPEFIGKGMKGVPSVADALGAKAVDYLQFAPAPDLNTAYNWLKESVMLKGWFQRCGVALFPGYFHAEGKG